MAHTLTSDLGQRNFNTTFFTNNATMLQPFIFATQALVILVWAENLGTKQAITFRFKSPVVDRFRLLNLTIGPGSNLFRRSKSDSQGIKFF